MVKDISICMETKFNFKSQMCTTVTQSEHLLALGLKKDTADMGSVRNLVHTTSNGTQEVIFTFTPDNWEANPDSIPRWSLHRLIEMALRYVLICGISFTFNEDAYEKVIGIIEHQIKEGYFNKEYLNGND